MGGVPSYVIGLADGELAAIGRTTLSASGGALADAVGWSPFFVIATLACLPGLALLVWVMRLEGAGER